MSAQLMLSFIAISLMAIVSSGAGNWVTVFEDNFSGTAIDRQKWKFQTGNGQNGWGNNELQYYTNGSNVEVKNGNLILKVKIENMDGSQYTSTRLNSIEAWAYGKFQVRARLPRGKNLWPAIWLFPKDNVYGGWAASGEIDMVEYRGERPNQMLGTLHFGGLWPHNINSGSGDKTFDTDFSLDYHLFELEWNSTTISWSINGKVYHTENIDRNFWSGKGTNPYTKNGQPFDQKFYWILNVAVGGNFFPRSVYGNPVNVGEAQNWCKTSMEIDFVRVSQWQII